MKKIFTLLIFLALFLQFSCKPEPAFEATTDVELIFKGTYGAETFMINTEYDFNGTPIRFDQFNFFIGNVVLVKEIVGNPEETELVEIGFVDLSFKPIDATDAARGFIVTAPNIPIGDYSGIKINIGVPTDLNKTSWSDYGSGHPLRRSSHSWTAWDSFIFAKMEAKLDIDNDSGFTHKLLYHTGTDESYRTKFFAKDITLEEGVTSNITFSVDAQKVFDGIDVMVDNTIDSVTQLPIINRVMDNIASEALDIE